MRAFLLASIALAAAVSASEIEKRSPFYAIHSSLVARADVIDPDVIPSQCKTACTDTVNDLNGCADIDCLCTNDNGKQLKKCVDCLVGVGGSDVTSSGQSTLDTFVTGCQAAGKNVDPLTVGGSSSNSNSNSNSNTNSNSNSNSNTNSNSNSNSNSNTSSGSDTSSDDSSSNSNTSSNSSSDDSSSALHIVVNGGVLSAALAGVVAYLF